MIYLYIHTIWTGYVGSTFQYYTGYFYPPGTVNKAQTEIRKYVEYLKKELKIQKFNNEKITLEKMINLEPGH